MGSAGSHLELARAEPVLYWDSIALVRFASGPVWTMPAEQVSP